MSLLFYTVADEKYQFLAPLYIYFVLENNPDGYVEIGLENPQKKKKQNRDSINILSKIYGDKFEFSTVNFEDSYPNAVRFITEPNSASKHDYVYIGDIDILVLDENIKEKHIKNMEENQAPFSNILRNSSLKNDRYTRLSGLHFAPTDVQYPLPDLADIDYSESNPYPGNDETVLYKILKKKGVMISADMEYRPMHGIHTRLGSHPFGTRAGFSGPRFSFEEVKNGNQTNAWGGIEKKEYRDKFKQNIGNPAYQELFFSLDIRAKNIIIILENICQERFGKLENDAYRYIISKYINTHLIKKNLSSTFIGDMYRKLR